MRKILIVLMLVLIYFIFPLSTGAATNSISKLVFTNDERSVAENEISGTLTIQLQNNSGEEEKLDITADVEFESTSSSGEFLGSTGKSVTKTMSTGSANKTFYYRDSNSGNHRITVTVRPRSGGESFVATQYIVVGSGSGINNKTSPNNDDSEESDVGDENGSHSSAARLSNYEKSISLKASAGRTRTVLVNTPIVFEAETNQAGGKIKTKIDALWSFGDGDADSGRVVTHTYLFPGEYNVVLNINHKNEESVSRTKVLVLDPEIAISDMVSGERGYVEIQNKSRNEININNWSLKMNDREYIIPPDTIIDSNKKIRIPNIVSHIDPAEGLQLVFPNDEVALTYKKTEIATNPNPIAVNNTTFIPQSKEVEKETVANELPLSQVVDTEKKKSFWTVIRSLFTVH